MSNIDNLKVLETLTNNLPRVPSLTGEKTANFIEIENDKEGALILGFSLYNVADISIMRWIMTEGAFFDKHVHNSLVNLIVYEGKLEVDVEGKKTILNVGDIFSIPLGDYNSIKSLKLSRFVSIFIPSERGLPYDGQH